ncbi:MAG TPA: hypothetical protein PLB92_14780 [Rhodoglobus sp.]|nr:hypothetical protein [Rhodoglobus sp.]
MSAAHQVPVGVALGFGVVPGKGDPVGHRVTYNWTLDQEFDVATGAEGYYHTLRDVIRDSAEAHHPGEGSQRLASADVSMVVDMLGETATVSYTDPDTRARVVAHFEAVR